MFENSSVMLILTFDNKAEYFTIWQVNTTVVGFVILKDGVCTNGDLLNDTTIYKVSCNTTTVSIEIIHAKRAMHDGNWLAGYSGVLYSTTIVVQGTISCSFFYYHNGHLILCSRVIMSSVNIILKALTETVN